MKPASSLLPENLRSALTSLGKRLAKNQPPGAEWDVALNLLAKLPASSISRIDGLIATQAQLYQYWRSYSTNPTHDISDVLELMLRTPKLEYLFLFHKDGYAREGALDKLPGSLPSPFFVAAVALRLNDWVAPVRQAAANCARRCFPLTHPDILAEAAATLVIHRAIWGRWKDERRVLDELFCRADIAEPLAAFLIRSMSGPAARSLSFALRTPMLDVYLERIVRDAVQPSVRAIGLRTLIEGRAQWTAGSEWQWIDKSMGRRRRAPVFAHRQLTVPVPKLPLMEVGVRDRSPVVRRVALDGVMRHALDSREGRGLAAVLAFDPSPSVRERAQFILARPLNIRSLE